MERKEFKLSVVLVTLFLITLSLTGQTMFMEDAASGLPEIKFRYLRPFFDGGDSLSFFTGIYDVTLSVPFRTNTNWVISIPISYYSTFYHGSFSESGFGNVYLGTQSRLKPGADKGMTASLGIYVPLISEDKFSTFALGINSNKYRMHKFIPNTLTLSGNIVYQSYGKKVFFKVEIGPDVWIPTKKISAEVEMFLHFGLGGGFYLGDFVLTAEFIGNGLITQELCCGQNRFDKSICFGVTRATGRIRPGLFYMISLDKDIATHLNGVLGLKVEIDLKK